MKNILTLGLFFFLSLSIFAQTDGISYQAVIIGPDAQELPGVDAQGNILPNATVAIRFTIYDSNNTVEYQEVQTTNTDQFGRINLMIGAADPDAFTKISWDGTNKDLKVEIDFKGGSNYVDMSREQLTFLPFAFHRNITATGTLSVDDATFLNSELTVQGPTNLNSTLDVNNKNATNLTGSLTVEGATVLDSTLVVNNKNISHLTGTLNVGEDIEPLEDGPYDEDAPTKLNGTLNVVGLSSTNGLTNKGTFSSDVLKGQILEVSGPITEGDKDRLLGDNKDQTTILKGNTTIGVASKTDPNLYNDKLTIDGDLEINTQKQVKIKSAVSAINIAYTPQTISGLTVPSPWGDVVLFETPQQDSKVSGTDPGLDINNYPLLIEGSTQGIAIKVNGMKRNGNNFIAFFDDQRDEPWGRIEGEVPSEFRNNDDYSYDLRSMGYDVLDSEIDLVFTSIDVAVTAAKVIASFTDVRGCFGFGACATAPGAVVIAAALAEVIMVAVKEGVSIYANDKANELEDLYDANKLKNQGVTYASGAGDYAEYLLREDINEKMSYGDIVGIKGGKISKNTDDAEKMMAISYKPIVLGNMPPPNMEKNYEKVAFMGQIPVKVFGKVNIGDYIIPSGKNDGLGIAISPSKITSKHIKNIVGVAWTGVDNIYGLNMVNVSVGLNNNDNNPIVEKLEKQISDQEKELNELKDLLTKTIERLVIVENNGSNYNSNMKVSHNDEIAASGEASDGRKYNIENNIIYFDITDADIERGLKLAEQMMKDDGVDNKQNVVLKKIKEDPVFKQKFNTSLKKKFDKQIHYHKEVAQKGDH